jgi:hypothetical protein
MSRHQQRRGALGEDQAARALHRVGVEMVERIATPVTISRRSGKPVVQGWSEKVSGDHRGLLLGGRSVLAETKTIMDRNLRYSDLRKHQPERLQIHATFGGLSLLVWVHESGVYVMEFPIDGFVHGTSLTPEQAQALNIERTL